MRAGRSGSVRSRLATGAALVVVATLAAACSDHATEPDNPTPALLSLTPAGVDTTWSGATVTLRGNDFVSNSEGRFEGASRPTEYVDATQLTMTLTAEDLGTPGSKLITVFNPAPGGGESNALTLRVEPTLAWLPVLDSISPSTVLIGSPDTRFTIYGFGFPTDAKVQVGPGGNVYTPTGVWQDSLRVVIGHADLLRVDSLDLYVLNPKVGNLGPVFVDMVNPVPTLGSISPTQVPGGAASLDLTVTGTGFVDSTRVLVNDSVRPTRRLSATQVVATLPATDLAALDTLAVTVSNPPPGGGVSTAAASLEIVPAQPVIEMLSSDGATAGSNGFDLTVRGRYFMPGSVARWNGVDLPTTYVGPTKLSASVPASDVASAGTAAITVYTPGGTSSPADFTIRTLAAPAITGQQTLDLPANDLVYSAATGRLYASVPSTVPDVGNSVVAIDPATGALTDTMFVGSEPDRLAVSDDGSELYVSFATSSEVRRLALPSLAPDLVFSLGGTSDRSYRAGEMAVMPGNPSALAVSLTRVYVGPPYEGAILLFDDGVRRAVAMNGPTTMTFATPDVLYGFDNQSTGAGFFTIQVKDDGLYGQQVASNVFDGFYQHIHYANGRIYGDAGQVVDPDDDAQLGTLAVAGAGSLLPDAALGRVFFVSQDGQLTVFDLNTFQALGTVSVPGVSPPGDEAAYWMQPVLWGTDGFAFRDGAHVIILRTTLAQP